MNLDRRQWLGSAACALAGFGSARAAAGSIDEQGFVRIGGIDQWIGIQGRDAANPAILYLHGGPAEAQSPFLKAFAPWEQDFTVVNWDQRGSGKTFGRNGPSTPDMTLERLTLDAIEVAEHVRTRLGKPKLVLVGQSWGAALGVHVVKRRPDLFASYVGAALPVTWASSQLNVERFAREQATAAGDQTALKALDEAAAMPINDMRRIQASARWRMAPSDQAYLRDVQGPFLGDPPNGVAGSPAPSKTGDAADWVAGGAFTIPKLLPDIFGLDITKLGYDFGLPVVVIEGQDDHVTSFGAARDWLEHVRAPAKAFVPIGGGHFACFTNPTGFVGALHQYVLPFTRGA